MRNVSRRFLVGLAVTMVIAMRESPAALMFEGRIVPPPERPASDYTVCLEHHEGRRETPPASFLLEQTPDDKGFFHMEAGPRSGGYSLYIRDDHGRALVGFPHLNSDRDFGEIPLREDGNLYGTVRLPEDNPGAGIALKLERKLEARCNHFLGAGETVTDTDGAFAFERLNHGSYRLQVGSEQFTHPAMDVEITDDFNYMELQLMAASSISGRVLQSDGAPAANISVQPDRLTAVRTDADGRYRIGGLGPGNYHLRVRPETHAMVNFATIPVTVGSAAEVTVPDITVIPVGALQVSLEHELPGIALPDRLPIRLTVHAERRRRSFSFNAPVEKGAALFEKLAPGTYQLQLADSSLGSVNADVTINSGETTQINLLLPEVFALRGVILDEAGDTVPEARIMFQAPPGHAMPRMRDTASMVHRHARSNRDGRFTLEGLPRGEALLTVQAERYVALSDTVTLPEERAALSFTLSRGLTVGARLIDEAGDPVAGVTLQLRPDHRDTDRLTSRWGSGRLEAESDADGRLAIEALSEGLYIVTVDAPEHYADLEPLEISAGTVDLGDLQLNRGQAVAGIVTEADGAPVSGARIYLHGTRTPSGPTKTSSFISRQAQTQNDGSFRIGGLPEGRYRVQITDSQTHEELVALSDIPAGSDDVFVILSAKKSLALHVFDPEDNPAADAAVNLQPEGTFTRISPDTGTLRTDADGKLTIEIRSGKKYTLTVHKRPWIDEVQTLDLSTGRDIPERLDIRMQAGLTLRGTVLDAAKDSKPGLYVTAGDLDAVTTDAQGQFLIEGVAPGLVVIQVHADPEKETQLAIQRLMLKPQPEIQEVVVSLPRPGILRGIVRDFNGDLLPNIAVFLNSMTTLGPGSRTRPYQTKTLDDASFEFATVMPGNYILMVPAPDDRGGMPLMRMVDIKPGETMTADLPVDMPRGNPD